MAEVDDKAKEYAQAQIDKVAGAHKLKEKAEAKPKKKDKK